MRPNIIIMMVVIIAVIIVRRRTTVIVIAVTIITTIITHPFSMSLLELCCFEGAEAKHQPLVALLHDLIGLHGVLVQDDSHILSCAIIYCTQYTVYYNIL